jgi:hypothetical protein
MRSSCWRSYGFESWPKLKAAVDGVTAAKLHEAAENGALETARHLLLQRPEIVDLGRGEMRALHMAVLRRDLEMTKLLLEFGADPDGGIWPNRGATSPYVIARDRGYEEIVDVLTMFADSVEHADQKPRPKPRASSSGRIRAAATRRWSPSSTSILIWRRCARPTA